MDTNVEHRVNLDMQTRDLEISALLKETKLLNLAKLALMLIDLYGVDKQFKKVGSKEGREVELNFPALDGSMIFTLTTERQKFNCRVGEINNPDAKIILNIKKEKVLKIFGKIIRSKPNIFGLLKLGKLYFFRKAKVEGPKMTALTLIRCLMIGKNKIYKNK